MKQIGNLNLYKNVLGTIELSDERGSRYCGKCMVGGLTITYTADTVEALEESFHKAVDEHRSSSTLTRAKEANETKSRNLFED